MTIKQTDKLMSYKQGLELLLQDVERAMGAITQIHLDPSHLNKNSREYRDAMEQLESLNDRIFRWKDAWQLVERATNYESQTT